MLVNQRYIIMSKILKSHTVKEKYHITIFDDGITHIDNLRNRCEPIELNEEQRKEFIKQLDFKFLYGHDLKDEKNKPVAVANN